MTCLLGELRDTVEDISKKVDGLVTGSSSPSNGRPGGGTTDELLGPGNITGPGLDYSSGSNGGRGDNEGGTLREVVTDLINGELSGLGSPNDLLNIWKC